MVVRRFPSLEVLENCLLPMNRRVVTQRYILVGEELQQAGSTSNVGIAAYACEALCSMKSVFEGVESWARALVEQILEEAVNYNGMLLWRWEARPSRDDYYYPPDWDDTCKAIDAIRAYEQQFNKKVEANIPSTEQIGRLLERSFFYSKVVGQDVHHLCRNDLALFIFIADEEEKPTNTEDIVITAAILRTLQKHYQELVKQRQDVIRGLITRLIEVAQWGLENGIPLAFISRCYFSWGHYLMLLRDIVDGFPDLEYSIHSLVETYLGTVQIEKLLPGNLLPYLIDDEKRYAQLLALRVGPEIGWLSKQLQVRIAREYFLPHFNIVYQHRRLGHFYGSPIWSLILEWLIHKGELEGDSCFTSPYLLLQRL